MKRVIALGSLLLAAPAAAQDAHYWSQQYGTRSELLAGAVVGSPQDLSTTYYNPGGLAQLETSSFLLSASAFEYQSLAVEDADGLFTDASNDRLGTAPSLFTGMFPRDWVRGVLAYSFLTRQKFDLRINSWRADVLPASDGEQIGANVFIDRRLTEDWGGVTWSEPFGEVGIGVSLYGAYRSQRGRTELLSQPIPTGSTGLDFSVVDDYSYWHFRMLAKIGLHWDNEKASVGLTFTTPGLGLFGQGRAAYHRNVHGDSALGVPDIAESQVENGLSVEYKSPASLAAGVRTSWGRSAYYLTVEWFDAVDPYDVLDASAFPQTGFGSTITAELRQELKSVVNVAVGCEYTPRELVTVFGSFLTDFSAASPDPQISHAIATWDILQVTAGAAFRIGSVDFTLGMSYGSGSEGFHPNSDVVPPGLRSAKVQYRRLRAFLGFEFTS
jgi:hypothetical protein